MKKASHHAARAAELIKKIQALRELVADEKLSDPEFLSLEVNLLNEAINECQMAIDRLKLMRFHEEEVKRPKPITDLLHEIERRREAGEGVCPRCDGTGRTNGDFCMACLGQRIVLSQHEYDALWDYANRILE
jgi:hypothetical protein